MTMSNEREVGEHASHVHSPSSELVGNNHTYYVSGP